LNFQEFILFTVMLFTSMTSWHIFVTGGPECPESDKTTGENGLDNRSGSSYKLNTNRYNS